MPEASAAPDHAKYHQLNNNKGNKGDAECDPKSDTTGACALSYARFSKH
jgi:hypothetical protein